MTRWKSRRGITLIAIPTLAGGFYDIGTAGVTFAPWPGAMAASLHSKYFLFSGCGIRSVVGNDGLYNAYVKNFTDMSKGAAGTYHPDYYSAGEVSANVKSVLAKSKVDALLIDGGYNGVSGRKIVVTGSANYSAPQRATDS